MRWFEEEIQRILAKEQEYMVGRFLHQHPDLDIEDVTLVFENHYPDHISVRVEKIKK